MTLPNRATRHSYCTALWCAALLAGCHAAATAPSPDPEPLTFAQVATSPEASPLEGDLKFVPSPDENAFRTATERPTPAGDREDQVVRLDVSLTTLHVQAPRTQLDRVETIFGYLREDKLSTTETRRLRGNGIRVGIGRDESWSAIEDVLRSIPDVRHVAAPPVRIPPNYPLALELDRGPRTQTLFHVGEDDILTGESWPDSRNVLRISYSIDLTRVGSLLLMVVPEVRQRREGWKWISTDAGVAQAPNFRGRAFGAAGFNVSLAPGEFVVIAPNRDATAFGLLGGAFLTSDADGQRFDSLILIRADINHVARRD